LPPKTATSAAKGQRADLAREDGPAAPVAPPRRARAWIVALVGAAIGAGFGAGVEKLFFGPPLIMVALGGMTLALSGLALWRVIDPLTRPEVALVREAQGRGRARELEREKQLVLKAIKEIELDYQMRKIADVDYREMIDRYRTRAMRLISEIDAGDNFRELIERELKDRLGVDKNAPTPQNALAPKIAPAPYTATAPVAKDAPVAAAPAEAPAKSGTAPNACSGCGTTNDEDAQFCKKCGLKLAS
jgi:hypothetical protein